MENSKIYRNTENKVIGGVCSGLADYFNLDVALLRVLFVIALLFASFGFWLYVILWVVLPVNSQQPTANGQQSKTTSIFAGVAVIFIGLIFLVNNFFPIYWIWKLWPLILVGIGVVMVYKASKKGDDNE